VFPEEQVTREEQATLNDQHVDDPGPPVSQDERAASGESLDPAD
jgi:hypothetical protein